MIFTYLRMHFGVPYIDHLDKNFKLSDAPVSKHLERPQHVYIEKSKILKSLEHNGMLKVFKSN